MAVSDNLNEYSVESMTITYSVASFYFGRSIGEGLFGNVFHAKLKEKGNADVAVKVMDKHSVIKMNRSDSVMNERRILTKLSRLSRQNGSEFIAEFFLSFLDDHNLFFVQELVTAGNLEMFVQDHCHNSNDLTADLPWRRYFLEQILSALEFIHSSNIVHGDLKPSNILLTPKGEVKIIDFGCAMEISCAQIECRSEFQGTTDYVPPEVIRGSSLSHPYAIDLWSFGCLISYCFRGESPFHSSSEAITIQSLIDYSHKDYSNEDHTFRWILPYLNEPANDLIQKLLHPKPESRIGSTDDVPKGKTYLSIRSHNFFAGYVKNAPSTSFHVPIKINLNVALHDMTDGASIGLDFFI